MADKPQKLTREFGFKIDRSKIDVAKRTVELAFSSENAVDRWWGENEILSHDKGEFNIDRLNNGAPLLLNHDTNQQIGVVESARVDSDKVGRAVVRFGNSPLADEIFKDVCDGIRQKTSFGYEHTGLIRSEKRDGAIDATYSWLAYEISIATIPADDDVGIGRSKPVDSPESLNVDDIAKKLTPEQRQNMKRSLFLLDPAPALDNKGGGAAVIDEPTIRSDERKKAKGEVEKNERQRAKEIMTACDEFIKDHGNKNAGKLGEQLRKMASECLFGENPVSIGEFQTRAMQEIIKATPAKQVMIEDVTDADGVREYSLLRGIQNALKARMKGAAAIPDGLEGEVHQEMLHKAQEFGGLGYEAAGFQCPANARLRMGKVSRSERRRMQRDMQATVFNAGGAFVPTQLVVPIIEILRNRMILETLGVQTMAGLQGNIVIPRQEATATAYSVSEIAAITASQQILGQIALSPKRVGATQNYSKQFVMQSTPDAESFMRDDLFKVIALDWDRLGLNGQGAASEPLGVFNTPGVGSVIFGGAATYSKIVDFETVVSQANADADNMHYITTPSAKGALKKVAAALTGATTIGGPQNALWVGKGRDGEMNGYPAHSTNQVPNNLLAFGDWSQCIRALWGGLDVVVDYYTKAVNAEVAITINTWGDFAVRHPQSFVISTDAANQ